MILFSFDAIVYWYPIRDRALEILCRDINIGSVLLLRNDAVITTQFAVAMISFLTATHW